VTGPVAGFIMPKITGHKQAFSLYSPKLRPQEFPRANWQFLIRSAANAARAFSVVHESGHVIGDVKHDNLLVGAQATVRLVDCDSYQITWEWLSLVLRSRHPNTSAPRASKYSHIQGACAHSKPRQLWTRRHNFSDALYGKASVFRSIPWNRRDANGKSY
jgi:hypothetical protein